MKLNDYILAFQRHLQEKGSGSRNTVQSYVTDLKKFEAYLTSKHQSLISASDTSVLTYMMYLQNQNFSDATIARSLSAIRGFFQYLIHQGHVKKDPTFGMKPPKMDQKTLEYLEEEEISKLLSSFDLSKNKELKDYTICYLMIHLGLKATEITNLKIEDLNTQMGFLKVETTQDLRYIKLSTNTINILEKYWESLDSSLSPNRALFYSKRKAPYTRQGVWKLVKKYGEVIDRDLNPRLLRNTCVVQLIKQELSPVEIKKIMGYSDLSILENFYSALS
jgi:integrase/recombinase XerD